MKYRASRIEKTGNRFETVGRHDGMAGARRADAGTTTGGPRLGINLEFDAHQLPFNFAPHQNSYSTPGPDGRA